MEGGGAVPPPPPFPPRTARQRWGTRAGLGLAGLFAGVIYHQFAYSRKVAVWREAMLVLEEELDDRVREGAGVVSRFKWYDPRGATWSWEWSETAWWRELVRGKAMSPPSEREGETSFGLRGEKCDVWVEARARSRIGKDWTLTHLKVTLLEEPQKEIVILDRSVILPDNMSAIPPKSSNSSTSNKRFQ